MTSDSDDNLWRQGGGAAFGASPLDRDLHCDLLVVGGGFTGCSAALEAARQGARVVLLEAETIGHGGSGRNVGLVNAGLWLPPDAIRSILGDTAGTHLIDALSGAPDLVFELITAHGIDCDATRNGTLHLAHAPSGLKDLESRFRQGNRTGAPLRLLDAGETARRTGSQAFHGALFDPRAGTIQPLAYCAGLAMAAQAAGARLFQHSPVGNLHHDGIRWCADAKGHTVQAEHLLIATNGYATGLTGVPRPAFVPVRFSQFATPPLSVEQRARILPGGEGCWDTDMVMSSLRLDKAGRLVIGGVGDVTGPGRAIHKRWAARKLARIYPELAGTPFVHRWQGVIAMTSDHLPKILQIGPNGLSVFGYSGRGIGPGTMFGQRAARALLLGDTAGLPVKIIARHRERLKAARHAWFECGAVLSHALRPF